MIHTQLLLPCRSALLTLPNDSEASQCHIMGYTLLGHYLALAVLLLGLQLARTQGLAT